MCNFKKYCRLKPPLFVPVFFEKSTSCIQSPLFRQTTPLFHVDNRLKSAWEPPLLHTEVLSSALDASLRNHTASIFLRHHRRVGFDYVRHWVAFSMPLFLATPVLVLYSCCLAQQQRNNTPPKQMWLHCAVFLLCFVALCFLCFLCVLPPPLCLSFVFVVFCLWSPELECAMASQAQQKAPSLRSRKRRNTPDWIIFSKDVKNGPPPRNPTAAAAVTTTQSE